MRVNLRVVSGFAGGLRANCSDRPVSLCTPVETSSSQTMITNGSASSPARANLRLGSLDCLIFNQKMSCFVLNALLTFHPRQNLALVDSWDLKECLWTRTDMWSLLTTRRVPSSSFSWLASSSQSLVVEAMVTNSLQVQKYHFNTGVCYQGPNNLEP